VAPNLEVLMNLEGKNLVVGNHHKGVEESKKNSFAIVSMPGGMCKREKKKIRLWVW